MNTKHQLHLDPSINSSPLIKALQCCSTTWHIFIGRYPPSTTDDYQQWQPLVETPPIFGLTPGVVLRDILSKYQTFWWAISGNVNHEASVDEPLGQQVGCNVDHAPLNHDWHEGWSHEPLSAMSFHNEPLNHFEPSIIMNYCPPLLWLDTVPCREECHNVLLRVVEDIPSRHGKVDKMIDNYWTHRTTINHWTIHQEPANCVTRCEPANS